MTQFGMVNQLRPTLDKMKQMNNNRNCKQLKLKKIVYYEFKNCHRYRSLVCEKSDQSSTNFAVLEKLSALVQLFV